MNTVENINNHIEEQILGLDVSIQKFHKTMQERGIEHALVWHAETVLEQVSLKEMLEQVKRGAEEQKSTQGLLEYLRERRASAVQNHLIDQKPWRHNSSSLMSHVESLALASALAELTKLLGRWIAYTERNP